jgi:hypothetical protein
MSVALLVEAIGNADDCGEMSSSCTPFHVVYALVDRSNLDRLLMNFLVKAATKDARLGVPILMSLSGCGSNELFKYRPLLGLRARPSN